MRRAATVLMMCIVWPCWAAQPPEPLKLPLPLTDLVKSLVETLKDTDADARVNAGIALAAIGSPAVDALTAALGESNRDARAAAAYALGVMGADATPAMPTLVRALKDVEADVRRQAAQALSRILLSQRRSPSGATVVVPPPPPPVFPQETL
jgi:HEAT repeat protein